MNETKEQPTHLEKRIQVMIHQAFVGSPVAVGAGEALSADPEHGVLAAADLAWAPGTHALGGARGVGHQAKGARGGRGREARVPGDIEASDQAKAHWHKGSVAQIYISLFHKGNCNFIYTI